MNSNEGTSPYYYRSLGRKKILQGSRRVSKKDQERVFFQKESELLEDNKRNTSKILKEINFQSNILYLVKQLSVMVKLSTF